MTFLVHVLRMTGGWLRAFSLDASGLGTPARVLATVLVNTLAVSAQAADAPSPALPILARTPQAEASPWTGLYVGTEIFAVGGKGIKGGFGGGGYAGYERELPSGWVVGIEGSTGYVPSLYKYSTASGYDYAETGLKAGYDMGRWMPFVTAGLGFAKPNLRASSFSGASGAANDLFNDPGNLVTFGSVGGGVEYKITNDVSVGLAVSATRGPAAGWP